MPDVCNCRFCDGGEDIIEAEEGETVQAAIQELYNRRQYKTPDPNCECKGSGIVDSGGTHPWGEAIYIPCGCTRI